MLVAVIADQVAVNHLAGYRHIERVHTVSLGSVGKAEVEINLTDGKVVTFNDADKLVRIAGEG